MDRLNRVGVLIIAKASTSQAVCLLSSPLCSALEIRVRALGEGLHEQCVKKRCTTVAPCWGLCSNSTVSAAATVAQVTSLGNICFCYWEKKIHGFLFSVQLCENSDVAACCTFI